MLDLEIIRTQTDKVKQAAKHKNIKVDIDRLLQLDESRRALQLQIDQLRSQRNEHAASLKSAKPTTEQIEVGKKLKEQIVKLESDFEPIESEYKDLLNDIPNLFAEGTPLGGEEDNKVVDSWGEAKQRDITDHLSWLEARDLVDFERGAKVAGSKFYYSKGSLAQLEMALNNFAMQKAIAHGFTPMTVPNMVNSLVIGGTGYAPRGEESQIYSVEGEDLNLIATAEIPLTAYHKDEILSLKDLPLLYVASSPCYRMEAGAYGKHSKGIFRVHQFYKVEMYVFCVPEESDKWHEKLMQIEEDILQELEIPYQKILIAAGDLGAPAYKKYDLEYFSPLDGEYREITSCSNVTDYQARRLNIRYKDSDGKTRFVHTLNGTAMVTSRGPIAVIENNQAANGEVKIPKVLQTFMGKEVIS